MRALSCLKRHRILWVHCIALVLAVFQGPEVTAQTAAPLPSITVALSPFQQKALLAFSSGKAFTKLRMTGTVTRRAGSLKETGEIEFLTSIDGSYTERWTGANDDRVLSCTAWGARTCTLLLKSKTSEISGFANQRTAPWFAPWMGMSLLSGPLAVAAEAVDSSGEKILTMSPAYEGVADLSTEARSQVTQITQSANISILLDSSTALPSGMHFVEPLSNDTSNAVDVSVVYGDYSLEQGFMVPHHIQRYIQRTLESDIHITSTSLN